MGVTQEEQRRGHDLILSDLGRLGAKGQGVGKRLWQFHDHAPGLPYPAFTP